MIKEKIFIIADKLVKKDFTRIEALAQVLNFFSNVRLTDKEKLEYINK